MTKRMEQPKKIKFIKAVYGKEKFDNNETIQFGNETIVAWYLAGYETLEELEGKYTDKEIEKYFEQQK
jgi:hypothetical protein